MITESVLDINIKGSLCTNYKKILQESKDYDIFKIIGINEKHSYSTIKLMVKSVISYLNDTNVLIIDISKLEYLRMDDSVKLVGFTETERKKVHIKVIAKPQLHKKLIRLGIYPDDIYLP